MIDRTAPRTGRESLATLAVRHPVLASLLAIAAAWLAVLAISSADPDAVGHAARRLHPGWLLAALACELISLPGYAIAYRAVVRHHGDHRLTARHTAQMVIAGFGAFAILGGFSLDRRGLQRLGAGPRGARLSVLALSLFELAILAPAAAVAGVVLLVGHSSVNASMVWPWVLGVPLGAAGFIAIVRRERRRPHQRPQALVDVVDLIERIIRRPAAAGPAALGMAVYFAGETAALALALHADGIAIGPGRLVIAYASGYLLTRRSLPLASAGFVEVLLTYALHWTGVPLASALVAVVAYRALNLVLLTGLALVARARLSPLMRFTVGEPPLNP